jgi:serine phosphatase RsbU (regulator of sigma subunit)/HAMP domain-containing protein
MEIQAKNVISRQQRMFEKQILDTRARLRKRLEPVLGLFGGLSQLPLLNRSWTGSSVVLPSKEEFIENLRQCFQKKEADLRYQCLSRDVELRVQASLLASNREFLENSIRKLLDDPEIVGVLVLDIDGAPYLGFHRTKTGSVVPAVEFSTFDASALRMEEDVLIDGDPFGTVIIYYSEAFIERARLEMESEHASTLLALKEQSRAELRSLTQARVWEGIALILAAAAAVTFVLLRGVLKPLTALKESAESLALGKFDTVIDISRRDELGDLARSFSHMREAVEKRIENLEKLNDLGKRLLGLHVAQDIFESVEQFLKAHYGASEGGFYLKHGHVSSAVSQALNLPTRFLWESLEGDWGAVCDVCFLEKRVKIQSWGAAGTLIAIPFLIRKECFGAFCFVAPEKYLSSEEGSFGEAVSHLASVTVENLIMLEEVRIKARMEADLNAAEAVQNAIIPKLRAVPNVDFAVYYVAAEKGMGDWYGHFFDAKSRRLYVYLCDVTGHGIAAALLTSLVAGVISTSHALLERGIVGSAASSDAVSQLHLVVSSINDMMRRTNESVEKSLTLAAFALDVDSGKFSFVNCAHPQPFHVSAAVVKSILGSGVPLGVRGEPSYEVVEGQLAKGDRIVFITDGLVENEGPSGKTFRRMALKKNLENRAHSAQSALRQILNEAQSVWEGTPLLDDVSVFVLDWLPYSSEHVI